MAVTKRVRYEVLRRDNHACRYCGGAAPDVVLTVDHVIPVALGGSDDPSNLVAACRDCNSGKTSTSPDGPLVAEVSAAALTWTEAMQQAAAERTAVYAHDKRVAADFRAAWEQWKWTDYKGKQHAVTLPIDFDVSIKNFLAAGLTFTDFEELIKVAMASKADTWKYFCGCAWRRIRQAQDRAAEIVTEEEDDDEDRYSLASTKARRLAVENQWREAFGFDLAQCLCSYMRGEDEFCGVTSCMLELLTLAHGAVMGPDMVLQIVGAPIPIAEEPSDGA